MRRNFKHRFSTWRLSSDSTSLPTRACREVTTETWGFMTAKTGRVCQEASKQNSHHSRDTADTYLRLAFGIRIVESFRLLPQEETSNSKRKAYHGGGGCHASTNEHKRRERPPSTGTRKDAENGRFWRVWSVHGEKGTRRAMTSCQ